MGCKRGALVGLGWGGLGWDVHEEIVGGWVGCPSGVAAEGVVYMAVAGN